MVIADMMVFVLILIKRTNYWQSHTKFGSIIINIDLPDEISVKSLGMGACPSCLGLFATHPRMHLSLHRTALQLRYLLCQVRYDLQFMFRYLHQLLRELSCWFHAKYKYQYLHSSFYFSHKYSSFSVPHFWFWEVVFLVGWRYISVEWLWNNNGTAGSSKQRNLHNPFS